MDAGSTGTRVHVCRYTEAANPEHQYPAVDLPCAIRDTEPGLSAYAARGEGVEESLRPLVDFALEQVPGPLRASTPIGLLATAGLRLLPPVQSEALLGVVRRVLGGSGFGFRPDWVRVLSGEAEGLYAWAAINYAAGRLQAMAEAKHARQRSPSGPPPLAPLGVLELGGASMQVTVMPWEKLPHGQAHRLDLPGVQGPLYTHSFLGYGIQVAWFREAMLVQQRGTNATDPCMLRGYGTPGQGGIEGSGDYDQCAVLAAQLLEGGGEQEQEPTQGKLLVANGTELAALEPKGCRYVRCAMGGQFLPSLAPPEGQSRATDGGKAKGRAGGRSSAQGYRLQATESFYYILKHLGLPPNATLGALQAAGRAFCQRPWAEVQRELVAGQGVAEEYALKVCFGAAWVHALLSKGLALSPREAAHLRFTNTVARPDGTKVEVNWVLGALLVEVVGGGQSSALGAARMDGGKSAADASSEAPAGEQPRQGTGADGTEPGAQDGSGGFGDQGHKHVLEGAGGNDRVAVVTVSTGAAARAAVPAAGGPWSLHGVVFMCAAVFAVAALVACAHWDAVTVKRRLGVLAGFARLQSQLQLELQGGHAAPGSGPGLGGVVGAVDLSGGSPSVSGGGAWGIRGSTQWTGGGADRSGSGVWRPAAGASGVSAREVLGEREGSRGALSMASSGPKLLLTPLESRMVLSGGMEQRGGLRVPY